MSSFGAANSVGTDDEGFVNPKNLDDFEDFVERFDDPVRSLSPVSSSTASQLSSHPGSRANSPAKENRADLLASKRIKSAERMAKKNKPRKREASKSYEDTFAVTDEDEFSEGTGSNRRASSRKMAKPKAATRSQKSRSADDMKPLLGQSLLSPSMSEFHRACQFAHLSTLVAMFRKGEVLDVDAVDTLRNTGLHEAALNGHWEVVRLLLKHGASLDVKNLAEKTPIDVARTPSMVAFMNEFKMRSIMAKDHKLICAIWRRRGSSVSSIIQEERDIERRLNIVNESDALGFSPLHAAALFDRPDVIKLLLKHGAEINTASLSGISPLHDACRSSSPEAIKFLLDAGADVHQRNRYGYQPYAMCNKQLRRQFRKALRDSGTEELDLSEPYSWIHFEEPSDLSEGDEEGHSDSDGSHEADGPFRVPVYTGGVSREERKLQQMLAIMNKLSPVKKPAAKKDKPQRLKKSTVVDDDVEDIASGEELRPARRPGKQPIGEKQPAPLNPRYIDKSYGTTMLHKHAGKGNLKEVKLLVKARKKIVNLADNAGYTALHEAALRGHLNVLRYLLEAGADIDHAAMNGDTPLHDASENGHVEVVAFLLQAGANRIVKNRKGNTALDVAENARIQAMLEGLDKSSTTSTRKRAPRAEGEAKPQRKLEAKSGKSAKPSKVSAAPASPPLVPLDPEKLGPLLLVRVGEPNGWFFLSPQIETLYCYGKPKSTAAVFRSRHKHLVSALLTDLQRQHLVASAHMKRLGDLRQWLADPTRQVCMLEKDAVYAAFNGIGLSFGTINVIYLDLQRAMRSSLADEASPASSGVIPPKLKMKMQRKGSNPSILEGALEGTKAEPS